MPLPCLLLGDHPALPSGLGRILRDLAQHLADDPSLDLDVRIVGCRPGGMGPDGMPFREGVHIPVWSFLASDAQAQEIAWQTQLAWNRWWGETPGVILAIWDAARLAALTQVEGPWELWGYIPVDAAMPDDTYRGLPAQTVLGLERCLAYGGYGFRVLKSVRPGIAYLPHGLDPAWWEDAGVQRRQPVIGCVMTNQRRKDWGVALQTIAELRRRGHRIKAWCHTDRAINPEAWSLPTLIDLFGLKKVVTITTSDQDWSDAQLRAAYQQCSVTMLPSLGEGFGYPIVESLASGVPCVHTTFGGGAELVPRPEWRVPERGRRIDGIYGVERPVIDASDVANAIERVWQWQRQWPDGGVGFCRGSVAHLRWDRLWPRWASWVRQGLEAR